MDPQMLIDSATPVGVPAPMWFVQFFKVLGFTLHAVPMNLWYAGILIALLLRLRGGEHGRRFGARLMMQMPVIVAVGVNLGIVPLLFVQLAYARFFYPATILMAWHWLAIIGMLIPAYYGVYYYAGGVRQGATMTPGRAAVGWASAGLFVAIGFIFANAFSLMAHVDRWPDLWLSHQTAGAATGTAWNFGDASFWPRWLLMFFLAVGTTAVWMVVDAGIFGRKESEAYRQWTSTTALKLYVLSAVGVGAVGSWYVFGTWSAELRETMFSGPLIVLTLATAAAPGLPLLVLLFARKSPAAPAVAAAAFVAQFGVLGINAISRQVVQNLNIAKYFDVLAQPIDVQWGPLAMFLAAFLFGLALVAWMIAQVVGSRPSSAV